MALKICQICNQKTDFYTNVHKKDPFINGKNYDFVCFTCFFVPKLIEQTYNKDLTLKEEIELEYSCENIKTAKDLYEQGSSDTLAYAKRSVEAVKSICKGVKKMKKPLSVPKKSWNICK